MHDIHDQKENNILVHYHMVIIIIIISYFNWVAISLRLLLKPPVSHTLAHTHNQIKEISLVAAVGHLKLLSCFQVGGMQQCAEKNSKWHMHRWSGVFCMLNAWLISVLCYFWHVSCNTLILNATQAYGNISCRVATIHWKAGSKQIHIEEPL